MRRIIIVNATGISPFISMLSSKKSALSSGSSPGSITLFSNDVRCTSFPFSSISNTWKSENLEV